jgi:hypothetical protein
MGTRTVRLDDESEQLLSRICRSSGMSVSAALKHGLTLVEGSLSAQKGADPYAIFQSLDLGPGGYTHAPARRAKASIRELIDVNYSCR